MSPPTLRPLLLSLLCVASSAVAHETSTALLRIDQAAAEGVELTLDLSILDVAHLEPLDGDGDGKVTAGEVRARSSALAEVTRRGLSLDAAGQPCALQPGAAELVRRADGVYFRQHFSSRCEGAGRRLRYGLLFEDDPSHRVLVRFDGEEGAPLILSARQPEVNLADAVTGSFARMVAEGVWHIWIGIDHILFLIALLLPAVFERREGRWAPSRSFWPAATEVLKVVSAFTVAHSVTLLAAQRGWVVFDARWVEVAIAISVVAAALNNLFSVVKARWTLALALGLLHGFGFSSVLSELGTGNVWAAVLAFNLGVELGQLAIVALFLPLAYLGRSTWAYKWVGVRAGSLAIAVVAVLWSFERVGGA